MCRSHRSGSHAIKRYMPRLRHHGGMRPDDLVGRTLVGVVASWYVTDEVGSSELLHVWLQVSDLDDVRCPTPNGVQLDGVPPREPYAKPELGARVEVEENTPAPLAAVVGGEIIAFTPLRFTSMDEDMGFVLHTTRGSVGSLTLAR